MRGATDEEIMDRAFENDEIIVTRDTDFGNIIRYPPETHPGAVVVRLPYTYTTAEINDRLDSFLSDIDEADLKHAIIVLELGRYRVRELYPNFEVWFASNEVERTALEGPLTAELDGHELQISPLELQLAYKLRLAQRSGSLDGKDFEDALHLYLTFGERLKTETLERFVDALGVEEYYAELERV